MGALLWGRQRGRLMEWRRVEEWASVGGVEIKNKRVHF